MNHSSTFGAPAKIIAIAALLFIGCCVARSDARVAGNTVVAFDPSKIVHNWYASPDHRPSPATVVASVQNMLTTPKIDASGASGAHVAPIRVSTEIRMHRIDETALPEIRYTSKLSAGRQQTVRAGIPGSIWVTERVTFWDDVAVDRKIMTREIVRTPKPAIVLQGTPKTLAQLRTTTPYRSLVSALTMVATAYTADTASAYPTGFTATGIPAREGVVAVDPRVIPLGSLVFVPGYGIAIAADTGGAIVGKRIDLCMDSYGDAVTFGRQTIQVYLLKR